MNKSRAQPFAFAALIAAPLLFRPVDLAAQQMSEVLVSPRPPVESSVFESDPFLEFIAARKAGVELNLAEFVQWVVVRNAAVMASRMQAGASAKLVEAEQALYEPVAYTRARHDEYDHPRTYEEITQSLTNISKTSALEKIDTGTQGIRGKTATGAMYDISFEMRRRLSNLLASPDMPEYRGTLTLGLKQPLLRGFGPDATETDLRVAMAEQKIEQQKFVKQLLDTTGEAIGVYWQLSRAQQTLLMRQRAVASAKELREIVQRLVRGGFSAKVDLFEAEALIGSRQTELAKAEQQLIEANSRIRNLLNLGAPAQLSAKFNALENVSSQIADGALLEVSPTPPEDLLDHWPSYQISRIKFEQELIRLDFAKSLELPDLSAELGYNLNSLKYRAHDAMTQITEQPRHRGWYYGLSLEVPLGNTAANSKRQAQQIKTEAARLQAQSEAHTAGNEWVIRVGQLEVARRECSQLQQDVEIRQALLQAERANYEQGRSRIRGLVEAEDKLQESKVRLLDGEARLRVAEVSVRALMGGFFASLGVTVQMQ